MADGMAERRREGGRPWEARRGGRQARRLRIAVGGEVPGAGAMQCAGLAGRGECG